MIKKGVSKGVKGGFPFRVPAGSTGTHLQAPVFVGQANKKLSGAWVPAKFKGLKGFKNSFELSRHPGTRSLFVGLANKSGCLQVGACGTCRHPKRVPAEGRHLLTPFETPFLITFAKLCHDIVKNDLPKWLPK